MVLLGKGVAQPNEVVDYGTYQRYEHNAERYPPH